MRDLFSQLSLWRTLSHCLIVFAWLLLVACTGKLRKAEQAVMVFAEPEHQYICVSDIYFGETARAHVLTDGKSDVPVGQWVAKMSGARFWTDSVLKASGKPRPTVAVGFAQGTGVRPEAGLRNIEVQIVLQLQIMKPTGNAYYELVRGRASGHSIAAASAQAQGQALNRLESVLLNAGICRQVQ